MFHGRVAKIILGGARHDALERREISDLIIFLRQGLQSVTSALKNSSKPLIDSQQNAGWCLQVVPLRIALRRHAGLCGHKAEQ